MASQFGKAKSVSASKNLTANSNRSGSPKRQSVSGRQKGRIVADAVVDQQHLEYREAKKTVVVVMMFILALCACLCVTWYLKDWISR